MHAFEYVNFTSALVQVEICIMHTYNILYFELFKLFFLFVCHANDLFIFSSWFGDWAILEISLLSISAEIFCNDI